MERECLFLKIPIKFLGFSFVTLDNLSHVPNSEAITLSREMQSGDCSSDDHRAFPDFRSRFSSIL